MEFGLQTIHLKEMKEIGRVNNMDKIREALWLLKKLQLSFETSIIYAIPGQTVNSFIDTIEYLIINGCKKIRAYPLSIARNSELQKKIKELDIKEGKNEYNVRSVLSSYSFPVEQREDMDRIAERVNNDLLNLEYDDLPSGFRPTNSMYCKKISPYQWEIIKIDERADYLNIFDNILKYYVQVTLEDIKKEDFLQMMIGRGKHQQDIHSKNKIQFINDYLSGKEMYQLEKKNYGKVDSNDIYAEIFKGINQDLREKKYRCKVHISKSNNIYVFREILLKSKIRKSEK